MKAILLDIEGTTTPIDFVHKTLFPYAANNIDNYVGEHFAELGEEIAALKAEHSADTAYEEEFDEALPGSVAAYLKFLIEVDRKSTPLKTLQGKIWQQGYENGELKGEVFADVPAAFKRWQTAGKKIAIYSSGSVLAQKLIFGHSIEGDLTKFITEYFDTTTGAKRDTESYKKIAEALKFAPADILFISDVPAELDAARGAGFITALSLRKGNAELTEEPTHRIIQTFDEITD
ncbi:MAG TPA: acireductone synthase [Pyrinomonadaceae bacterium]|jgi:enolase-phosphatase E1|nr:acireductone synthase [Pyrinomonadaceae bacterium]